MLMAEVGTALAQPAGAAAPAHGIYSCNDGHGRTITSDRPIADCIDREQRELSPSGTTRRRIEPTWTAKEQADRDERQRQADMVTTRQLAERRRERALLIRYPNATTHDRERADTLAQIDIVIGAAKKRLAQLGEERRKIEDELEFYKKDISKAPALVRRQLDDNVQSVAVQNRFIGTQEDEKRRLNARFDEERVRLKQLWAPDGQRVAQ